MYSIFSPNHAPHGKQLQVAEASVLKYIFVCMYVYVMYSKPSLYRHHVLHVIAIRNRVDEKSKRQNKWLSFIVFIFLVSVIILVYSFEESTQGWSVSAFN